MTVREEKAKKQALYDLGWHEDESDAWRCMKCKKLIHCAECCCGCGRCECNCGGECCRDAQV